ncbi:phage head-tail adapter protein [Bacillus sp. FJAT-49705]|uniref:Phage head-tail adapter protein n=1 Tax=Cytobacillus citreus TaxID=2833586 RepID=A0ABS5NVN9_9BACI|nr:phage head-tail adapter protein [Cytobacillus citreus]MBS4191193.1 phage head-tail adapter protein [Cytobacillus citreus]
MTFDYELTLIDISHGENEMGDTIDFEVPTTILCDVLSVSRSEHYAAATHDLKPSIVFVVNKYEYEGQSEIEFEGKRYKVIRDYLPLQSKGFKTANTMNMGNFETIELTCEEVKKNGNA